MSWEAVQAELRAIDPSIRLRFDQEPKGRRPARNRWVVERADPEEPGRFHLILVWQTPEGDFMPPDQRIVHKIHEMDTWRYGARNVAQWVRGGGRRAFLNAMGQRETDFDPFETEASRIERIRFREAAHEYGDRLFHHLRQSPDYAPATGEEEKRTRRMIDEQAECSDLLEQGLPIATERAPEGHIRVQRAAT